MAYNIRPVSYTHLTGPAIALQGIHVMERERRSGIDEDGDRRDTENDPRDGSVTA